MNVSKNNIDEYIQQGLTGIRETKPDERRKFLGTLRERVVVALTRQQVREKGTYKEVEELMNQNKEATLFLNGKMNYKYLSDYIKLANNIGCKFLISTNKEYETELGLVLAYDYAINKEDIYIKKLDNKNRQEGKEEEHEHHLLNFFKKLF